MDSIAFFPFSRLRSDPDAFPVNVEIVGKELHYGSKSLGSVKKDMGKASPPDPALDAVDATGEGSEGVENDVYLIDVPRQRHALRLGQLKRAWPDENFPILFQPICQSQQICPEFINCGDCIPPIGQHFVHRPGYCFCGQVSSGGDVSENRPEIAERSAELANRGGAGVEQFFRLIFGEIAEERTGAGYSGGLLHCAHPLMLE